MTVYANRGNDGSLLFGNEPKSPIGWGIEAFRKLVKLGAEPARPSPAETSEDAPSPAP